MPDKTNDGLGGTGDDAFSELARRLADGKILDDMAPYGPEVMGPPPTEPDPPVESVLGDLSRPIVDAFSGHVTNIDPPPPPPPQPPLTEFGQAVRAFQRAYVFVSEHMAIAIVASLAIVFALAGVAFFSNAACGCDEPAQSGSSGAPASSARATAAAQVAQPTASPTLVRLTQKIVTVGFDHDGVCDPYVIRFVVLDQTLAGHTVVLELKSTPLQGRMKEPTKIAPPQRVEGLISADAPYIETPVYAFTSADVTAILIDGKPAFGSAGFGNKGALDCS